MYRYQLEVKNILDLVMTTEANMVENTHISLQNSSVPEDWKITNITPIFKKGQNDQLEITGQLV